MVRESIKVFDAAGAKFGFKLDYTDFDFGGDRYIRTNEALPDSAADDLRQFPAILLGAIGHPDVAFSKGYFAEVEIRTGAIYQPKARQTLR